MFWQANKWGLIALAIGLALVIALYFVFLPYDELVAERILSTGICIVIFIVAFSTYLFTRRTPKE